MLKRHQVLLTDWLTDYIKNLSKKYDVSFSEVIRVVLCLFFGEIISSFHPKYKFPFKKKEIVSTLNKIVNKKMSEEEIHRIISQVYFEARKAIEYRLNNDRKIKKKPRNS